MLTQLGQCLRKLFAANNSNAQLNNDEQSTATHMRLCDSVGVVFSH